MNNQLKLPEGWIEVTLKDITHKVMNVKPENAPNKKFRYIDISSIDNKKYIVSDFKSFYGKDAPSRARRPIRKGDVLFSNVRTYLKNIAIVSEEFDGQLASTGFTVLSPNRLILSKYLFRWIQTSEFLNAVTPEQTGSSYPATSDKKVLSQSIFLPPLAEQKRIVKKVEALLARVNAARERLDRVPALLKRFRQAVLSAACSGRLTEVWREENGFTDLKNSNDELPSSWRYFALDEICVGFQYGSSKKSEKEGKIPVLRMGNIQNGEVDWSDLKYTSDESEIKKYHLKPNTVLFNRTNSPELVGKTAIYRGEKPAISAGYLIRILHGDSVNPFYLNYCMNRPDFKEWCLQQRTDGVSQSNINAKKLSQYKIPFCDIEEQKEIVHRIEALFKLAKAIEVRVEAARTRADKLTQSILAKAFRGELVPTEADLARREGREYETAEALLEKVKNA